jgi:hypothetical protein
LGISLWTIISFLLGTGLGSGSIWEWQKVKLEAQKQVLEVQKQDLDRAVQTTELRRRENDQYSQIIDLTKKYVDSRDAYSKSPSSQIYGDIAALRAQLDLMKDDFVSLESKLARLEGRQPRIIPLDFTTPAPPSGLTAIVH